MDKNLLMLLPNIEQEEMMLLNDLTKDLNDEQQKNFFAVYQGRRKDPQTIMIVTILGFLIVAGIQRFMLNQIGMGILYLFTGGLCLIGTIIDLVNYKKMTLDFNRTQAIEALAMSRM